MKLRNIQLAILAAGLAVVPNARAVLVHEVDVSPNQVVGLHVSGTINYNGSVYAGIYNLLVAGDPTPSFCIDVYRNSILTDVEYAYQALDTTPLSPSGPMGVDAAANVEKLWAKYFTGAQSSSLEAAALQVAIWQQVAIGHGGYTVTIDDEAGFGAYDRAAEMIAALGSLSVQADLVGLVNGTYQNYAVVNPVPEPTTMIAGALLLLPFGASTLRMLRKSRKA